MDHRHFILDGDAPRSDEKIQCKMLSELHEGHDGVFAFFHDYV